MASVTEMSYLSGGNITTDRTTNVSGVGSYDVDDDVSGYNEAAYGALQYWLNGVLTNIVVLLGLIGNILTIVILSQRAMRSSTNYYLTALAVWDSVVLICTFLLIGLIGVHFETYQNHFHSYVVAYIYPVALIAQTATIWLTVSFTVERYIAVCHPLKAARMCTISRAKFVIIGVSVGSSLYNVPRWFDYTPKRTFHPEFNETILTYERTEFSQNPLYLTGYFSCLYVPFMFIIPFLVLFILNAFLILAVRRSKRNREINMNVRQSRENNITIMLVTVVIVFMICQLPALVYNLAFSIDINMVGSDPGYHILSEIRNFMVNLNSAVNFILYCALGQKFRRIFLHTFCRRCLNEAYMPMSGVYHNTTVVSLPSQRAGQRFGGPNRGNYGRGKDAGYGMAGGLHQSQSTSTAVHKTTPVEYHAVTYKNSHGDGCAYPTSTTTNGADVWKARHQRASELLNSDCSERANDYTTEKLLPEQSGNSYPMYEVDIDNGRNAPV
ncbi:hypothetical protein LSH36_267g00008 [Paralvinella palmiformis]|uniref:G-protein coupled receptors family 1 profile domain-containing protein n=1 Tax=Paralvinella palmiformis TaxID=53620 RepID=A0AAD9N295_9ANNE|nr:hypothetical protein LSH36_267g00008 [Paralvinella palmiformis]